MYMLHTQKKSDHPKNIHKIFEQILCKPFGMYFTEITIMCLDIPVGVVKKLD